jgi:hypothetical protein
MASRLLSTDDWFGVFSQCGNERRQQMSAELLKRKIRNFPAAKLSERLAA